VAASGVYHSASGLTMGTGQGPPSASLVVPPGVLPDGTIVTIYAGNATVLANLLPANQIYLDSFAVSWAAPDGSSPKTSSALSLTVTDPRIGPQALLYQTTATGIQPVTGGLAAGRATFGFTADPGFLVAAPVGSAGSAGYWLTASDGGIFNYGAAGFFGSTGSLHLNKPIVGMAGTPSGQGYFLVATDGGIFSFGDAGFFGSTGSLHLNKSIVGMAAAPDGKGYWLVASDGGIFSFGTAGFFGSTGSIKLNQPIVGMAAVPDGRGYWLAATDGGIFNYGDAAFFGSAGSIKLNKPVVALAATPDARGYWLAATDGGIFNYGDAGFFGSTGSIKLNQPIVGMAAR
jgi:hypothetical protein